MFFVHNRVQDIEHGRGRAARARARGAHRRRPRADGRGHARAGRASTSGRASTTCSCARRSSSRGIDMPTVNTLVVDRADLLGLGQLHQLRGRVGRSRPAGLRLPVPSRRTASLTEEAYERLQDDRRGDRARARASRSPCATSRSAAPATCSATGQIGPHRRGRLRPLLPDGHRGGGRAEGRAGRASRPRSSSTLPLDANLPAGLRRARRSCGSRPTAAWPRSPPTPRSTTSGPSGRTATARCRLPPRRCSRSPACGPSATGSASARSVSRAGWCG